MSEIAIQFSRMLQKGMRQLEERRQEARREPYRFYCDLIQYLRSQHGIEHVPIDKDIFQDRLSKSADDARKAFMRWLEETFIISMLDAERSRKKAGLHLLCDAGPDPELFCAIDRCAEKVRRRWCFSNPDE